MQQRNPTTKSESSNELKNTEYYGASGFAVTAGLAECPAKGSGAFKGLKKNIQASKEDYKRKGGSKNELEKIGSSQMACRL